VISDGEALYRAVCENPTDDVPRLVYADWLEEAGNARWAAFIREQVRKARELPPDLRWQPTAVKSDARLTTPPRALPPPPRLSGVTWLGAPERGFWAAVGVRSARVFLKHADQIFAAAPVRYLSLGDVAGRTAEALADCPYLARLTNLVLGGARGLGDEGFIAIVESPHLTGLRLLNAVNLRLTDPAGLALAASPLMRTLEELDVSFNDFTDATAEALVAGAGSRPMRVCALRNAMSPEACLRLFGLAGRGRTA
jgi:uncharacterized protein (TIGR02996 family)